MVRPALLRSSLTLARLKKNYVESADGAISRQALYASYQACCERLTVRPVNPAAFGRSVRSTFSGTLAGVPSSLCRLLERLERRLSELGTRLTTDSAHPPAGLAQSVVLPLSVHDVILPR